MYRGHEDGTLMQHLTIFKRDLQVRSCLSESNIRLFLFPSLVNCLTFILLKAQPRRTMGISVIRSNLLLCSPYRRTLLGLQEFLLNIFQKQECSIVKSIEI